MTASEKEPEHPFLSLFYLYQPYGVLLCWEEDLFLQVKSQTFYATPENSNCSVPFNKCAPLIPVHAVSHPQHSISYETAHNEC